MSQLVFGRPAMFLKLLRHDRRSLSTLLEQCGADVLALSTWLKNPHFVDELENIMSRMDQIQELSSALARYNASEKLSERVAAEDASNELLEKAAKTAKPRRAKRKRKTVVSYVHDAIATAEKATLMRALHAPDDKAEGQAIPVA